MEWILHHDNAPTHNAIIIREFLTKNETNTIQQPSNSLDMAPCDFFLFDQIKKPLWGTRFKPRRASSGRSQASTFSVYRTFTLGVPATTVLAKM